jgi:hypothetical protein
MRCAALLASFELPCCKTLPITALSTVTQVRLPKVSLPITLSSTAQIACNAWVRPAFWEECRGDFRSNVDQNQPIGWQYSAKKTEPAEAGSVIICLTCCLAMPAPVLIGRLRCSLKTAKFISVASVVGVVRLAPSVMEW